MKAWQVARSGRPVEALELIDAPEPIPGRGATGAHAEWAVRQVSMTFGAADRLNDAEAAAFFYPFHMAYLGLDERGRLRSYVMSWELRHRRTHPRLY